MAWIGIIFMILVSLIACVTAMWLLLDFISRLQSFAGGAPWVPLEDDVARVMWQAVELQPGEKVIDLGCGDARHIIYAVRNYPITAVGVEVAFAPLLRARWQVWRQGLGRRIQLSGKDLRDADLSDINVVFLYLSPKLLKLFHDELVPKLVPGTRIVTARFPLPSTLPPRQKITSTAHPIYLYTV